MLSHPGERQAMASALWLGLRNYREELQRVADAYDPEACRALTERFDDLRLYAACLPELSVPWVSVVISRAEMTIALFKGHRDAGEREKGLALIEVHRGHVDKLGGACIRLLEAAAVRAH